ncbi:ATP-binding protein [Pseudoalteromonas sp. Of7M-16]|uniref:sensor histidine kinase n=1 Tax=Pseudoalteromonas sp. Of7M-16 TaxID=2917756 RepID=UPI001EF52736|nr:ATP-binding protein [Pseudoalteromonas sp. Of7M-16]MCG7550640.1 ATP-binding protein [Pseudoalteromonas sp. Of7M-16]
MWRFVVALVSVLLIASILLGQIFDTLYSSDDTSEPLVSEQLSLTLPLLKLMALGEVSDFDPNLMKDENNQRNAILYTRAMDEYPLPALLQEQLKRQEPVYLETQEHVMVHLLTSTHDILIYQYDKQIEKEDYRLSLTLSFYLLLVIVIVIFLAPFVRRLMRLSAAATKLGDGQLDVRLQVGTLWYIRDIELSFNQMASKISLLMDDIKLLAGGLSHELRTPLARVRMGLDTLVEAQDEQLRTKYESRVNQQLDDMEGLLIHMLDFARLQHSLDDAKPNKMDLAQMLSSLISNTYHGSVEFTLPSESVCINADLRYLNMAVSNIIDNAIKYGRSKCAVKVFYENNDIAVSISDDGQGIDAEKRATVFKPFVRLDRQQCPGFGIGLAFSAKIISRYHGTVEVDDCPDLGGARFTLRFVSE